MFRLPLQLARSVRLDAHPGRQQRVRPALRPERLSSRRAAQLLFPKRLEPPALRLAEDSLELRRARGLHALDVRARLVVLEPAAVLRFFRVDRLLLGEDLPDDVARLVGEAARQLLC